MSSISEIMIPLRLGIIVLVVGGLAVFFLLRIRRASAQARAGRGWPTVLGTVVTAMVQASTHSNGRGRTTSYFPQVVYTYEVDGQRYHGRRIAFGAPIGRGTPTQAQQVIGRYAPGSAIQVFYNPANPAEAVLEPRAPGNPVQAVVVAALLVALIFSVISTLSPALIANLLLRGR